MIKILRNTGMRDPELVKEHLKKYTYNIILNGERLLTL